MAISEVIISEILSKKEIADGIFEFIIDADNKMGGAKAGQFIHVKCDNSVFLRRPISICEVKNNTLRFIFQVRGKGTEALSKFKAGDKLNVLGPLGNGFSVDREYKHPVVIGGGIGIYPLLQTAKILKNADAILGFRNKDFVTLEEDFNKICANLYITTDDGSYVRQGLVTDVLMEVIKAGDVDAIFACGPMPMLKAIKEIAEEKGIFTEVSLEERMGCGIGACLCCATPVKDSELEEGYTYAHVCSHGPVFNASEVIL
ncbi:MAG: dihydroorotate dehydrogenase electron transfer subunit [Ruminococcaceae bacterium]|nr:dihydroorotate dehydrogenase electron transfer subunit [Oscillospiraceae bacterium]